MTAELAVVNSALLDAISESPTLRPVHDQFGGQVFESYDSIGYYSPAKRAILARAGMVFIQRTVDNGRVETVGLNADPERLLACSLAHDIPIKFIGSADSQEQDIPAERFAEEVLSRRHPVGVDNLHYYIHDTGSSDHFPAVIVGGRPLLNWLVANMPRGIDDARISDIHDSATYYVTSIIDELTGQNAADPGRVASYLRLTSELFGTVGKRDTSDEGTVRYQERQLELRHIIYDGLKSCGVHRPELVPGNRWSRIGRSILFGVFGK